MGVKLVKYYEYRIRDCDEMSPQHDEEEDPGGFGSSVYRSKEDLLTDIAERSYTDDETPDPTIREFNREGGRDYYVQRREIKVSPWKKYNG